MKQLHEYETSLTDKECGFFDLDTAVSSDFARDLERKLAMCRDALREIYRKPACEAFEISQNALESIRENK